VDRSKLLELCRYMSCELTFDHCACVCGTDDGTKLQTVYHIVSYSNNWVAEITVDLPYDDPRVDSVSLLWGGANWHERETYDMYGIIFDGHPKLERILLPEDYMFFPMRKERPEGGA